MEALHTLAWPLARLGEALEMVARHHGLPLRQRETPTPPEGLGGEGGAELGPWLETAAAWLGLEAEPVEASYVDVASLVRRAGPALLHLPGADTPCFLALLGGKRHTAILLGPDLAVHRHPLEAVCAALCQDLVTPLQADVERLLDEVGVAGRRRGRVRAALLRQRLGTARLVDCWLLRLPTGTPFRYQLRHAGVLPRLVAFVGVYGVQYGLWLLSWWLLGQGALQGRLDRGWLLAWALLLLTLVPLRMLATRWQGALAIGAGGLLKRRLLAGVLRLAPEEMRHQGAGQLLGGVIEAEAVEALALNGGMLGVMAGIELGMAVVLFGAVPGGGPLMLLLLGWGTLTGLIGWHYLRQRQHWTAARLGLTHDLVERMVGHRTRLAQEDPAHWHDGEDQALARYLEVARVMDRTTAVLLALVPRGWMLLGVLGVAPAFLTGATAPAVLAVNLGGVLLAAAAYKKLATGLWQLAGAAIAWQHVAPLFHAATRPDLDTAPPLVLATSTDAGPTGETSPVLEAHDLVFRYRERSAPVLRGCSLRLWPGERLLLEGPSGGGKSTLATLLLGLRQPESGLVLLDGLDRHTLGAEGWRRRVVAAPQFQDNHVFTGTVAFNLLMGRRWPPHPEDMAQAEALCRALGLGPLLDRMPAGLLQMVGESGWQLSQGERSRLYIARTLLQSANCLILDESFAALDPETLRQALQCVLERAPTLLVIAHP
jgi:ABC-type multidrug transport system fused ATPase/permease subunit